MDIVEAETQSLSNSFRLEKGERRNHIYEITSLPILECLDRHLSLSVRAMPAYLSQLRDIIYPLELIIHMMIASGETLNDIHAA
jgi:hypothetical protein